MTAKSCLNCSQLGSLNIGKTGRRCYGIPSIPEQFPVVIPVSALSGFYCGRWNQKELQPTRGEAANTVNSNSVIQDCETAVDAVLRVLPPISH